MSNPCAMPHDPNWDRLGGQLSIWGLEGRAVPLRHNPQERAQLPPAGVWAALSRRSFNGDGGSRTHVRSVPGRPGISPAAASALPPELGPFLWPLVSPRCADCQVSAEPATARPPTPAPPMSPGFQGFMAGRSAPARDPRTCHGRINNLLGTKVGTYVPRLLVICVTRTKRRDA